MAALAAGASLGAMRADVVPLGEMSRSYDPVLLCDRMQCGVEEADDVGFPGLGRGDSRLFRICALLYRNAILHTGTRLQLREAWHAQPARQRPTSVSRG